MTTRSKIQTKHTKYHPTMMTTTFLNLFSSAYEFSWNDVAACVLMWILLLLAFWLHILKDEDEKPVDGRGAITVVHHMN